MKKHLFFILLAFSFCLKAQLPYLNASTGNLDEFPVDKDTNMYMFHENLLVKTDKNFNTIWAYTYGNLKFNNLLLSKTGSIFFIANKSIGKIESNGTISWCKDLNNISAVINGTSFVNYTTSQINSLLLDRNNHFIVTGNVSITNSGYSAYYLKLDTLGNPIKLAPFNGYLLNKFSIINDSLGYYRFMGGGGPPQLSACHGFGYTLFNDNSNNFINGHAYIMSDTQCADDYRLVRSKFNSGYYIHSRINYNYGSYFKTSVLKCNLNGQIKWGHTFDNCLTSSPVYGSSRSLVEDYSGNIFLQVSSAPPRSYGVLKIDSNGVTNNSAIITHSWNTVSNPTSWPIQYIGIQKIAGDNLYTHYVATGHPISPLNINLFKSSLSSSCYTMSSCNPVFGTGGNITPLQTPTLELVTSFSITTQNLTSNTTTFAVNTNSCTLQVDVGLKENNADKQIIKLHPNPTSNILKFDLANSATIEEVRVLDVNGKMIKKVPSCSELNVSELLPGMYFLQLMSDGKSHYAKFFKE